VLDQVDHGHADDPARPQDRCHLTQARSQLSAIVQVCGDAIVTGMARTNATDLVLIVVR
jgi:hypothetical protein